MLLVFLWRNREHNLNDRTVSDSKPCVLFNICTDGFHFWLYQALDGFVINGTIAAHTLLPLHPYLSHCSQEIRDEFDVFLAVNAERNGAGIIALAQFLKSRVDEDQKLKVLRDAIYSEATLPTMLYCASRSVPPPSAGWASLNFPVNR